VRRLCALAVVLGVCSPALASGAAPQLRGLGIDDTVAGEASLTRALEQAGVASAGPPVFVRLLLRNADLGPGASDYSRLDARLDAYRRLKIPVVITLTDPPTDSAGIDAWRTSLRALAEHLRGSVIAYQVGDRLDAAGISPKDYAYLVKFVAIQVRSIDTVPLILQAGLEARGAAQWQAALYREDAAAYVDGVALVGPAHGAPTAPLEEALLGLDAAVAGADPTALIGVTGMELPTESSRATQRLLTWHLSHLGGRAVFTTCTGSPDAIVAVLKSVTTVRDVLSGEVVTLDEQAAGLTLHVNGQDVTAALPHRLLYNLTTFATYLLYWSPEVQPGAVDVRLRLATVGTVAIRDAVGAVVLKPLATVRDEASKTSAARVEVSDRPLLLDFNFGAEEVYALRSDASERLIPTVEEIVFRHQQAETAQAALVRNYIAKATVSIHFQPTALDSYDVVLENRFFSDSELTEWEELSFTLNGTRWGADRPPFPLLQAEKVLSLPLALRLNRDYVYHFDGTEDVGGRPCYVVRFDPIDETRSLYRGRVWIDQERYLRMKVQSVQTRLTAPVASNEEVQTFDAVGQVNDQAIYLFTRLVSQQLMQIAGRNVLVVREVDFSDFRLNVETFQRERAEARSGKNIMFRETDAGLRYLVKRGDERVVSDKVVTSARALAAGVTFDPSYQYPVPLFGINYANFNFLDRGLQLSFMFAGVVDALNLQKPNIGGSRVDVSLDFLGVLVKSDDLVFDETGERVDERLQNRRVSTGVNLGYQATDFQKFTLSSHVQFDQYLAVPDKTSPEFVVPASGPTVEVAGNYEYRRGGYSLLCFYGSFSRATWTPWGDTSSFDPATQRYTKYSASLSKEFYIGPFSKIRLNGAYYGGQREDRFSMYRFGLFDESRMRGIPTAGVRFSELGMVRASYSFNMFDLYRLALYVDHARGRTPENSTWAPTTGVGAEVNLRGPKTTMIKFGIGKGFLPQLYKGSGSLVVELMVFKPI
jgi:hypothetical protein